MECLYHFKYDEKNDQFLLYLNSIGKSYLKTKLLETPTLTEEALENKEYIKNFFKVNQESKRTFDNLKIVPYE
jgi:hypothetical protein